MYIPKDKVVLTTQHVRGIETIDRQEETLSDDHADIKVQTGVKKRATKSRKARMDKRATWYKVDKQTTG